MWLPQRMILSPDLKPKGCALMTGDSPPEVTGEANVCPSCSLTIVTELVHDMGNGRSLPVLCLVLSQNCMTRHEICNVPVERSGREREGEGRGRGKRKKIWRGGKGKERGGVEEKTK